MSSRQLAKRPRRKNAVGDFRDLVTVHATAIVPRRGGGTVKTFTPIGPRIPMKVESLGTLRSGFHGFNEVNVAELPTHRFTARWRADITAEHFLEFKGSYHEIIDTDDPEGRREYLVMTCRRTGAVAKEASAA